jgi:hypothetical protein
MIKNALLLLMDLDRQNMLFDMPLMKIRMGKWIPTGIRTEFTASLIMLTEIWSIDFR